MNDLDTLHLDPPDFADEDYEPSHEEALVIAEQYATYLRRVQLDCVALTLHRCRPSNVSTRRQALPCNRARGAGRPKARSRTRSSSSSRGDPDLSDEGEPSSPRAGWRSKQQRVDIPVATGAVA